MSNKDFILKKIGLIKKDGQEGFKDFVDPLQQMVDDNDFSKTVEIEADNNWFTLNFKAVQVKEDRLVITAKRKRDGLTPCRYDSSILEYAVEFHGTRAAYLYGYYKPRHPVGGWPYIYWDIRSYANHPKNETLRTYVNCFRANDELRKLITAMENAHGTSNIVNKYINDNKARFIQGINAKMTPQEIEKKWSQGLMESLGYQHVEAFDVGYPKGSWKEIEVHWCKKKEDLRS